jgi:prepilin-type N-terminal cleavage/methylation domain-containing protein
MNRRPGVTLLEVLITIFIMGIGMLALLALFPLGALSMAQALKDERVAQAARNAEALAVVHDWRNDSLVRASLADLGDLPQGWNGPGYPVYVDAIGRNAQVAAWVGQSSGTKKYRIPRVNVSLTNNNKPNALRSFSLLDDVTFTKDGSALDPDLSIVQREGRYSWAYLMKRPQLQVPSAVDVAVVVYSNRVFDQTVFGIPPVEPFFGPPGIPGDGQIEKGDGDNTIRFYNYTTKPAVKAGTWLLDVSYEINTQNDPNYVNARKYGPVHGIFYRVVSATDTTSTSGSTAVEVELTPTVKGNINAVVVMEYVAEVVQKSTDWRP